MPNVFIALVSRENTQRMILAFKPGNETAKAAIPAHAIVGEFRNTGSEADWKSFSRNTRFVEFFTQYMQGKFPVRPDILDAAKVEVGEFVYVIDRRAATPNGDVPFHEIIGWYKSDAEGRPAPDSFVYNGDHRIALDDGTQSSILSDSKVHAAILAASA